MAAERTFVDTNVLVYANQARSPFHEHARLRLASVERACVSRQVLREYCAVVTRPQADEPPLSPWTAIERVETFRTIFDVIDDTQGSFERLLELVASYSVKGRQIHDANIVATMDAHGIRRLLTANPADFRRFADLIEIEPL